MSRLVEYSCGDCWTITEEIFTDTEEQPETLTLRCECCDKEMEHVKCWVVKRNAQVWRQNP